MFFLEFWPGCAQQDQVFFSFLFALSFISYAAEDSLPFPFLVRFHFFFSWPLVAYMANQQGTCSSLLAVADAKTLRGQDG